VYILTQGRGGRHTPFFKRIPAAVLLPYNRRYRSGQALGWRGNGDARATTWTVEVELGAPIAMEEKLRFAVAKVARPWVRAVVTKILA